MSNLALQTETGDLKLSELITALSHALDITEGQPPGHCMRSCWVGMHIASELDVSSEASRDLYYSILLKDLGCSSNAARICELYATDDLSFKKNHKLAGTRTSQLLKFLIQNTGLKAGMTERIKKVFEIIGSKQNFTQELIQSRCSRGAQIAKKLQFSDQVCAAIHSLDEHYDGKGNPAQLKGDEIPLFSRIALLSQVVDVYFKACGKKAAVAEVKNRRGTWFDPEIVDAFLKVAEDDTLWQALAEDGIHEKVLALEPAEQALPLSESLLDEIALAFGQVVDAKSPFTAGHSERVATYSNLMASHFGLPTAQRRWVKRAALLHDIGKLGVSNSVLDKPDKLTESEWGEMKKHPVFTEQILSNIDAFKALAQSAAAHHEKLDGSGYPKGLAADQIDIVTRIITTADIFDALSADRPYREAMPLAKVNQIMTDMVGTAIDQACFTALQQAVIPCFGQGQQCG